MLEVDAVNDNAGDEEVHPGPLVSADRGVACIDALDKMSNRDAVAIREVCQSSNLSCSPIACSFSFPLLRSPVTYHGLHSSTCLEPVWWCKTTPAAEQGCRQLCGTLATPEIATQMMQNDKLC